jgi:MFS family permease
MKQPINFGNAVKEKNRTKTFWLSSIIVFYSFFLFCQGIWSIIYYLSIYGYIDPMIIPSSEYGWITTMYSFTMALVLATPVLGGLILMVVGYWIMNRGEKNLWSSVIVLIYSFVLLFQTVWVLFGFPNFSSELYRYIASMGIFTNFPIFFTLLGAVIPPLVGSMIFLVIGSYLIKISLKEKLIAKIT